MSSEPSKPRPSVLLIDDERPYLEMLRAGLSREFEIEAAQNTEEGEMRLAVGRYDAIVCNPPFHTHARADRPDIGRRFIAAAAQALQPAGRLWLVANRHLPYEQALGAGFDRVRIVTQQHGFKIVEALKAKRA